MRRGEQGEAEETGPGDALEAANCAPQLCGRWCSRRGDNGGGDQRTICRRVERSGRECAVFTCGEAGAGEIDRSMIPIFRKDLESGGRRLSRGDGCDGAGGGKRQSSELKQ